MLFVPATSPPICESINSKPIYNPRRLLAVDEQASWRTCRRIFGHRINPLPPNYFISFFFFHLSNGWRTRPPDRSMANHSTMTSRAASAHLFVSSCRSFLDRCFSYFIEGTSVSWPIQPGFARSLKGFPPDVGEPPLTLPGQPFSWRVRLANMSRARCSS